MGLWTWVGALATATVTSSAAPPAAISPVFPDGFDLDRVLEVARKTVAEARADRRPTASSAASKVVVTARRAAEIEADAPVRVEVMTRDEVRRSGAEDLAEALEDQPGVDVTRSFRGAGVRLLGLDPEHVLVLVDGQRIPGRIDGVLDLGRIPAEQIERIEVVKGPSSALFGSDALGGVINVVTRRPKPGWKGSLHSAVGSQVTADASGQLSWADRDTAVSARLGYHRADPFDLDPDDAATTGSAFDTVAGGAEARWRAAQGVELTLGVDAWHRRGRGVDVGPPLPSGARAVYDRSNETSTGRVFGRSVSQHGVHRLQVDLQGSLFFDDYRSDQRGRDGAGSLDSAQDTRQYLSEATLQWDAGWSETHLSTLGVTGLFEQMSSPRLSRRGDRGRASVYAQHEWLLDDGRFSVVPGVRVDADSVFGVFGSPKLALRYAPISGLTMRASYGWGFRAPTFRELLLVFENPSAGYVVEGSPDLRPERSQGFTAGADWRPTPWLTTTVEGYYNLLSDLIQTSAAAASIGGGQRFAYTNVGRAMTRGVEATAQVELGLGVAVRVGYALLDAVDQDLARRLEGRATHRVSYRITLEETDFGTSAYLRGQWVSARNFYLDPDNPSAITEASPYATLDARVQQKLTDVFRLFAGGDNLLGAGDPTLLTLPPRSFYVGLDADL